MWLRGFLWLMSAVLFTNTALAQEWVLKARVTDEKSEGLEMANLMLLDPADSSVITYGFTDSGGNIDLKVPRKGAVLLRITSLGYQVHDELVNPEQRDQVEVKMQPQSEVLQTAQVVDDMPIVISGDTISYKADAFNSGTEKKLEDVLKNLPGVEVDEDGQVKFEGKQVEKVMVEGKDFFDGDTKLATKNIPANAVDRVQVLRNYNDVSPLGGVTDNQDRIALNIKLKEGKKNMLFGDVEAMAGLDERYLLHPNLFFYNPKLSVNLIADANNIGQPAFTFQDYFRFSGGFRSLASRSGSGLRMGNNMVGLPLGQNNRAEEIISEFGALNFSYNPTKKLSLSGFIIGSQTDVQTSSERYRSYVGLDSLDDISETLISTSRQDQNSTLAKISAKYTPSSKVHIDYSAFGKLSESRTDARQLSDFGFFTNQQQTADGQRPRELSQSLNFYYDKDENKVYSLELQHQYQQQDPLFLLETSQPLRFDFIPLPDSGEYRLRQNQLITTNSFRGIGTYYYVFNDQNHLEFSIGGSYNDQRLTSGLSRYTGDQFERYTQPILQNDVEFFLSDLYGGIHYKTIFGKLMIRPGVNMHWYHATDTQLGGSIKNDWLLPLPDFLARYNFKKTESLSLRYSTEARFMDINQVAMGAILSSYNSVFIGNRQLNNAFYHNLNLDYRRFNMFSFTTIYAMANYSKRIDDIINTVGYVGLDRINMPVNSGNANDMLTVAGGIDKRFGKLKANLGGTITYSVTNNRVNDVENTNTSFTRIIRSGLGTIFKKMPNVDFSYTLLWNNYQGANLSTVYSTHRPALSLDAPIWKSWLAEADYEINFYQVNGETTSIYDFFNASVIFNKPDSKWSFKLVGRNILSTNSLREDSFSDNLVMTSDIAVLPRYVLLGLQYDL